MTMMMIAVILLKKAGWLVGKPLDRMERKTIVLEKKLLMKCG